MLKNKIIKKEVFLKSVMKSDLIWIGEIHGIKENYAIYKKIIPDLAKNGFKNFLWEMESDFSETSIDSEDGRINRFSINFLKWVNKQIKNGRLEKLTFFGNVGNDGNGSYDEKMAAQFIDRFENKKSIVISGNFHMGGPINDREGIQPCLTFVKNKTGLKILKIGVKYAGGNLYNYGIKKMSKTFYFGDENNLKFGTITKNINDETFFVHAGKAHAVFKKPSH